MAFADFIKNLQEKPDHIKTRILWGTSAVAAVIVVGVWFTSFKHQIQSISGTDILNLQSNAQSADSKPHYLTLENAQNANGKVTFYFSIQNDTDDILNFSTNSDVSMTLDGKKYTPTNVANRQNQAFAKKILSHSQTWGILTFDNVSGNSGTITFDNLYFEQSPQSIFKETLDFDLDKLTPPESIRN